MSSAFPNVARTLAAVAIISLTVMASSIASVSASASTAAPARVATSARPAVIQGYYKTYSACNAAGAAGVRAKKWTTYVCYESDLVWVLDTETIVVPVG
jgi:hypothetical protein